MSTTLTNSFVVKAIAALVVVATLITMTGVASVAPVSAQVVVDGSLVKTADNPDVYIVKIIGSKTFKRLILNPTIFDSYGHLSWDNIITVSQSTLDSYTTSNLVIEVNPDGSAVNGKVYVLTSSDGADTGTKQHLNVSASEFEAAGLDWASLYHINQTEAGAGFYPEGAAITDASQVPGANGDGGDIDTPGVEGELTATLLAVPSAVEIGKGQTKSVMGVKLEADDSTIKVQRVDVALEGDAGGGDDRPWRTFDRVQILVDGDVVATKSVSSSSDFTKDDAVYTIRFTNLSFNVPADGTENIEVALRVRADAADAELSDEVWTASIPANGIRGLDGASLNTYAGDVERDFTIVDDAASLAVSTNVDSPESGIVQVSTSSNTNGIELLSFDVEAGDADITVTEVTVDLATSDNNVDDVTSVVHLYRGNTKLGSVNVPVGAGNTEEVTFEDLTLDVDGDETVTLTVKADAKRRIDGNYAEGTTLKASIDAAAVTFEFGDDEEGTSTGTAAGEDMYLYSVAPQVELVSSSIAITPDKTDAADASLVFDVTAVGGDIYFADQANLPASFVPTTGAEAFSSTFTSNATRVAGTTAGAETITFSDTWATDDDVTVTIGDFDPVVVTMGADDDTPAEAATALQVALAADDDINAIYAITVDNAVVTITPRNTGVAANLSLEVTVDTAGNGDAVASDTEFAGGVDGYYRINEGQTRRVTVNVHLNNDTGDAGFFKAEIDSINWGTANNDAAANNLPAGIIDDFETNSIFLSA